MQRLGVAVSSAVVSPDGQRLAVGTEHGTAHVLDAQSLEELFTARISSGPVLFRYRGPRLLAATDKGIVEVEESGASSVRNVYRDLATAFATSPSWLALGRADGRIEVRRNARATPTFELRPPPLRRWWSLRKLAARFVEISPDEQWLAAAFDDETGGVVCVYSLRDGARAYCQDATALLENDEATARSVRKARCVGLRFGPHGTLVSVWSPFRVRLGHWASRGLVWDTATGKDPVRFGDASAEPLGVSGLEVRGRHAALVRTGTPRIDVIDLSSAARATTIVGHSQELAVAVIAPNDRDFFSVTRQGEIVRWSVDEMFSAPEHAIAIAP